MEFRRIANLPPYVFTIINNLKIEARRAGRDVIDLGFGNPDIPSPDIAVRKLAEAGTVLEICPSSNLRTHALPDLEALGAALRTFEAGGVRYTINTDGPYLLQTHLRYEYQMLLDAGILTEAQVERVNAVARAAALLAVAGLGVVLVARFNHVLDAALARLRSDPKVGMVGCRLVTESGELDHAAKRSFPTPLSALAHFTGLGRRADAHREISHGRGLRWWWPGRGLR